ncbi:FliA/WhiG family RNA polymerase sigma factor [Neobacillus soli]|uniref:FliA/WhiG family RNA polymerase sigma factor n=1 Tax=Neobacillus soli TaxID=220688 RepID=UPI000824513E|nr:FliA/WhiG family RNA polymerase sigma factor [Neobacillus soli]
MSQLLEEKLFDEYLPLVKRIVKKTKKSLPHNVEEDELLSFGMLGLLDAFRKFDQRENVKFETYATQRIRGEIYDGLRRIDPLPRTLRKKEKEVRHAYTFLEQKLFRQPSVKEVGDYLHISETECKEIIMLASFEKQESLYEPTDHGGENQLKIDFISDSSLDDQSNIIEGKERSQQLTSKIDELPERDKIILSLIYNENLSMNEVGRILGLHKSRISQLHSQILKKLKKVLEKESV